MLRSLSYIDAMLTLRRSYKFYQVSKINTNVNDQLPFFLPRVILPGRLVSALLAEDILWRG